MIKKIAKELRLNEDQPEGIIDSLITMLLPISIYVMLIIYNLM